MLVLTRKVGEQIFIGDDVCLTVVQVERGKVRIGIEAPRDINIRRSEIPKSESCPSIQPFMVSCP